MIFSATGKVIASGLGKSGIVANKVAATLSIHRHAFGVSSPGGRSSWRYWACPEKRNIGLLFSNSGENRETLDLLQAFKRLGLKTIAVTGRIRSTLSEYADCALDASVKEEACPLGLAPTSSVIVALALGDALAGALMDRRGFTQEDYRQAASQWRARQQAAAQVSEVMHKGNDLPLVISGTLMSEALLALTSKAMGGVIVVDKNTRLCGIYTDGDLKRSIQHHKDFLERTVDELMTADPVCVRENRLAVEAFDLMENRPSQISVLPVVDEGKKVVGIIRLHHR